MKGTIIKRGSTYSIVYDIDRNARGKRQQKWESGFRTKRDAQEALNKKLYDIQNNEYIVASKNTIREYLESWFSEYVETALAINTINGYRNNIYKHIIPELGNVLLGKLQPIQIQRFYNKKLADGLSPTSVLYIHRVLHRALEQAYKMQIINRNVSEFVELPRKLKYKAKILTESESRILLNTTKDSEIFLPVLLSLALGLRRGETLGLRWSDIDLENMTISVNRTAVNNNGEIIYVKPKTEKSNRIIKASSGLIEILAMEKKKLGENAFNNDNVIVRGENGLQLSPHVLDKRFKKCLKENGLPEIRFHDLRHTNATLMLKNHIPAKIASERLGHSSIGITMDLYSHVLIEMQEEAAEMINNLLL